jgi:hypothetical protein
MNYRRTMSKVIVLAYYAIVVAFLIGFYMFFRDMSWQPSGAY